MKASNHARRNKRLVSLFSLGMLAAILISLVTPGIAIADHQNPIFLADSYIIIFNNSVDPKAAAPSIAQAHGLQTGFIYEHALKGMSAIVPPGRLTGLLKDPRVAYVVEDMERKISAQTVPTGIQRIFADDNNKIFINGADDWRVDVDVAVIDTGIDLQHPDLNVINSTSCMNSSGGAPWLRTYYCGAGGDDDHYHGTHVAGTIAALDNEFGVVGVAPGARLWAVKVCDARGSCPSSAIIAGIDYVASNAAHIEVANMSLGGSGYSQAEYDAIQGAVNKGVAFAVAAGNDDDDASNYSPAAFDNVLTVSALADFDGEPGGYGNPTCFTDQDDTLAYFSNWGSAVDIAAPGACILSTFPIEQGEYGTISGTSMASPHAAGALALLASRNKPSNSAEVAALYSQVINAGNFNWTDDSGDGIQERLLDVGNSTIFDPVLIPGSEGGGGNTAPVVSITSPENGASFPSGAVISFSGTASDLEDGDLTANLIWTSSLDGQIGMGGTFSRVLSEGTHTITATVTDTGGLTGSKSISASVESEGGSQTISVVSLAGTNSVVNRNFWKATVQITVDPAVGGAVVSGSWSTGGTVTCTTVSTGTCTVTSNNLRSTIPSTTFTVLDVTLAGYEYIPISTEVTINKP